MRLQYTGHADLTTFTKADFERHGVEGAEAARFDARKGNWADVPDSVGEWLLEQAPHEFKRVDDATDSTLRTDPEAGGTDEGTRGRASRRST